MLRVSWKKNQPLECMSRVVRRVSMAVEYSWGFSSQPQFCPRPASAAPQILSHEINHGYKLGMLPVETFNGTTLHNLAHLAHLVDSTDDPYLNFGLDGGRFITLDRQQVQKDTDNCCGGG